MDEFPDYAPLIGHRGRNYVEVLAETHAFLRPSNYLEIGVNTGATLALARCVTIAVDPQFNIGTDVMNAKPRLHLFQQTSDAFFTRDDISGLLGGPLALGFLDGLHHAEVLLRDVMNAERYCDATSVLVLHDCIPVDTYMARRRQTDPEIQKQTPTPRAWTGDVWKTLAALKRYRQDLRLTCLDAVPTGLVYVTGLDAQSTVISDRYADIVSEMDATELTADSLRAFVSSLDIVSTDVVDSEAKMRAQIFGALPLS